MNSQRQPKQNQQPAARLLRVRVLGSLSIACLLVNLCVWLAPLTVFSILKLLAPTRKARALMHRGLAFCYRSAAAVNSFWIETLVGIDLRIVGSLPKHPSPLVIANHRSWFDIVVLQRVLLQHSPIVKFLIKRELIWVPVLGWICLALNLPRLRRGQGEGAQRQDFATIREASKAMEEEGGALLIFPEGTRFTEGKRRAQASPYKELLRPKPAGLRITLSAAPPKTPLIDITLAYEGDANFWHCLGGATSRIHVIIDPQPHPTKDQTRPWLQSRWQEKDFLVAKHSRSA